MMDIKTMLVSHHSLLKGLLISLGGWAQPPIPEEVLFSMMDSNAIVNRLLGRKGLTGYEPEGSSGHGGIDCLFSIILNNPEATMTTESGSSY